MISERRAQRAVVDGADCILTFDDGDTPEVGIPQLLLDARGKLVGVDLGAPGFARVVVMVGAHEDVASQTPARVSVSGNTVRVTGGARFV